MCKSLITIGFSSHRVESIPFAKKLMEDFDLIMLEDAPTHEFTDMLHKKISIDAYVREEETEFPEFSRRNCKVLRELYQKGKKILQVEPYMEQLMHIHSLFAEGKKPSDIMKIHTLKNVYDTERKTTAALIHFYEASMRTTFQKVVEAVKTFARVDAERFRLRDTMRAKAIAKILFNEKRVYIEAGGMHIYLEKILKKILRKRYCVKTESLIFPAIRKMTGKHEVSAPGDLLTIHYILNKKKNDNYETLLAAKSLIYIKLLITEEMLPSKHTKTPHIKDEIMANELVRGLTFEQCEELFEKIRFQNRQKSLETLHRYL
jgi:2-hydroxy-3-keto-5-methylthiopentenyl-1-phosphate phosphatase